jgi:hypothetical protein
MPEESTTPDLVELAQRRIDSVNAGDIGAATSLFAREIVWEGCSKLLRVVRPHAASSRTG